MAKRKSITGVRKRKQPSKQHLRASNGGLEEGSQSPNEDMLQRPIPGELLHLRTTATSEIAQKNAHPRAANAVSRNAHGTQTRPSSSMATDALEARHEHVTQKTIEAQWDKPDARSQQAMQALLLDVHLPVLANFPSERAKLEAQEFLQIIESTLSKRVPKTPFPRGTTHEDFNFEYLSKTNRDLQDRTTQATTRISSLKRTIDEQESALESDQSDFDAVASSSASNTDFSWLQAPGDDDQSPQDLPERIHLRPKYADELLLGT